MIPIPHIPASRPSALESAGIAPVAAILPVKPTGTDLPRWQGLPPGTALQLSRMEASSTLAAPASGMAWYQLSAADMASPALTVQLPATLSGNQVQFLGMHATLGVPVLGVPVMGSPVMGVPRAGLQASATSELSAQDSGDMQALDADLVTSTRSPLTAAQSDMTSRSTAVDLTATGRWLQHWLVGTLADRSAQTLPAPLQAATVMSQHPEKPVILAQDLKQALDHSGLFYESHLKQATLGTRPWQQLMAEPQNQPQFVPSEMVVQQLQVLEQQRVQWQGEVWPGQHMQWQVIAREDHPHAAAAPDAQTHFFSNLTLQLPVLGTVSVRLTLSAGYCSVRLQAESAQTAMQLQHARSRLLGQLQEAGLLVDTVQVVSEVIDA